MRLVILSTAFALALAAGVQAPPRPRDASRVPWLAALLGTWRIMAF